MSSGTAPVSHAWVLSRIGRRAAGVLDESEEHALEAHLETCGSCHRAAMEVSAGLPADGHIPSALLAGWAHRAPALDGELRRIVQYHLERCPDCRRELEMLGEDPGLIREPRLETGPAKPPSLGPDPVPARLEITLKTHVRPRNGRRFPAPAVAAALLATAAALVTVFQAGILGRGHEAPVGRAKPPGAGDVAGRATPEAVTDPTVPPARAPRSTVRARESAPLLALGPAGPGAGILTDVVRGSGAQGPAAVFTFDPVRHEIALIPPRSLALAEGERVELALIDSAGAVVLALETRLDAIFPAGGRQAIVLRQGHPPLAPGAYLLRVRVRGPSPGDALESRHEFTIR